MTIQTTTHEPYLAIGTVQGSALQKMVKSACVITEQCTILTSETGLQVRVMDPSHVVMLDMIIPRQKISDYTELGSKYKAFSLLDLERVDKILKRLGEVEITLRLNVNDNRLELTADNGKKYDCRIEFYDCDMAYELQKLPPSKDDDGKIVRDTKATMSVKELIAVIDDVKISSEFLTMSQDKFSGGDDHGRVEIPTKHVFGPGEGTYSIDYLLSMLKANTKADLIAEFGTGKPLVVKFGYTDVVIDYWIAPRVEH